MDERDPRFQSNEIAREFAVRNGANVVFITAPVAPTPVLAEALKQDPESQRRFALWDQLAVAVVGIGGAPASDLTQLPAHMEWARRETDAVGDVAGRLFRLDGTEVGAPLDDFIGITREQLERTPLVIAAAAGAEKTIPIIGAARSGLIDLLVTDQPTARAVLASVTAS
jgi:DNA-binding transcriptional regulator LsrR (DeoR family)